MMPPLPIVDGFELDAVCRSLLMPHAIVKDPRGKRRRLPRFFYVVESWALAMETRLTPHFALWEFINVDLYEPEPLRHFPRYVPCAVSLLAAHLEVLRIALGMPLHIAANGGYRSPSHKRSKPGSPHSWATAANLYRIGDEHVDDRDSIERYSAFATDLMPALRAKPYGPGAGYVDDHIHLDLGYVTSVPTEAPDEE
jgi:hypothetical protein